MESPPDLCIYNYQNLCVSVYKALIRGVYILRCFLLNRRFEFGLSEVISGRAKNKKLKQNREKQS